MTRLEKIEETLNNGTGWEDAEREIMWLVARVRRLAGSLEGAMQHRHRYGCVCVLCEDARAELREVAKLEVSDDQGTDESSFLRGEEE